MPPIIKRRQIANEKNALQNAHPVLQRIYAARNIQNEDELARGLDQLLPFQSLLNIELAAKRLSDAIIQDERILIVGDFDADGATSTTVAMRALRSFGAKHVSYLVPNRFAFGYGLTPELVAHAQKESPPNVILTVDNGIANHAGVDAAKALGIAVVVTDHHLPAETLPNADVIVNPNQPHDTFPSKCMAGVGVVFYVMLALRRHLVALDWFAKKQIPQPNMSRLLDLVALGTVADVVPLDQNNRILIHQGLLRIRQGQCAPGIIGLLETAQRDFTRVTASDLGYTVAARLNAAGRLDDMSLGIECLLEDDPILARHKAKTLNSLNLERRDIEQEMQQQALTILEKWNTQNKKEWPKGIAIYDPAWHQGVIGILASRIKERYHRPVIVFAPGQENEIKGSARSIPGFHIRDALAFIDAQHPKLIKKFGGHAMAAGLTLDKSGFAAFSEAFAKYAADHISDDALQHVLWTDGALESHELNLEVATLLRDAGPFGQLFPEPLFDDHFEIVSQRMVADKHLKLQLRKHNQLIDCIAFFVDQDQWPNHRAKDVHAAFRLDVNEYKGKQSMQLILEHITAIQSTPA